MLNPLEFRATIDRYIAEHYRGARRLHVGRVTDAILSALPPEDRRGIDRELLCLIVKVRASRYQETADVASAAA